LSSRHLSRTYGVEWINLAQNRDVWRAPADTVMHHGFQQNFLTGFGSLFLHEGLCCMLIVS